MATNRYTVTSPVEFDLPLYSPNFELISQGLQAQQARYDKYVGDITKRFQALTPDITTRDAIVAGREQKIDEIAEVYRDKGVVEGNKLLKDLRREVLSDHMTGGKSYAIESNFNKDLEYQKRLQDLFDKGKIESSDKLDKLLKLSRNRYKGVGELSDKQPFYNVYNPISPAVDMQLVDEVMDWVKGWESDRGIVEETTANGGTYYRTVLGETVDPKTVREQMITSLINKPGVKDYVMQEAMLKGLSGQDAIKYAMGLIDDAAQTGAEKAGFTKLFIKDRKNWWAAMERSHKNDKELAEISQFNPWLGFELPGAVSRRGVQDNGSIGDIERNIDDMKATWEDQKRRWKNETRMDFDSIASMSPEERDKFFKGKQIDQSFFNDMMNTKDRLDRMAAVEAQRIQDAKDFATSNMTEEENDKIENFDNRLKHTILQTGNIIATGGKEFNTSELIEAFTNTSPNGYRFHKEYNTYTNRGTPIFHHSVITDENGNEYFFREDEYKKIKKLAALKNENKELINKRGDLVAAYIEENNKGREYSSPTTYGVQITQQELDKLGNAYTVVDDRLSNRVNKTIEDQLQSLNGLAKFNFIKEDGTSTTFAHDETLDALPKNPDGTTNMKALSPKANNWSKFPDPATGTHTFEFSYQDKDGKVRFWTGAAPPQIQQLLIYGGEPRQEYTTDGTLVRKNWEYNRIRESEFNANRLVSEALASNVSKYETRYGTIYLDKHPRTGEPISGGNRLMLITPDGREVDIDRSSNSYESDVQKLSNIILLEDYSYYFKE